MFHSRAIAGSTGCGSECARSFCLDATIILSESELQIFSNVPREISRGSTAASCCILLHYILFSALFMSVFDAASPQIPSWKKGFPQNISRSDSAKKKRLVVATELQYFFRVWVWRVQVSWATKAKARAIAWASRQLWTCWLLTQGVLSLVHRSVLCDAYNWIII